MPNDKDLLLVINCGSSSLKFALFEQAQNQGFTLISEGLAEALGSDNAQLKTKYIASGKHDTQACSQHADAIQTVLEQLEEKYQLKTRLGAIGHRVVHGGEAFSESTRVDAQVLQQISDCIPLAPLHNPANLQGIKLLQEAFPELPQVAVFDTAFHQTMPKHAYLYALPYKLYRERGVRRYGFHGSSHRYVAREAATFLGLQSNQANLITAHLGNGASIACIKNGQCVDTSMGMTPLEGLVMGTRSGDIDPGIFDYLSNAGYSLSEINRLLNKESGLLGISELSNDMRTLIDHAEKGHEQAGIAIEIFCYRLAKYVAAMMVPLKRLDALVFTGGIGENSDLVRTKTLEHLELLNFGIDPVQNSLRPAEDSWRISSEGSITTLVIRTNEELMIAEDTAALV